MGLKKTNSVFKTFRVILLALSQFVRLFKSRFKFLFSFFRYSLAMSRLVSSAKWKTLLCLMAMWSQASALKVAYIFKVFGAQSGLIVA